MSRKKAGKGKNANSSPTTGIPTGNQKGETGKSTAGTGSVVQANGMVHPSRPSLSNSSEFYDIAYKVMLVGDSGVGKTCLLVRFKDGAFLAGSFISTVGIDFRNEEDCRTAEMMNFQRRSWSYDSFSLYKVLEQQIISL